MLRNTFIKLRPFIIIAVMAFACVPSYGQKTIEQLQEEIKQAQEDIKRNTELLDKTRNDQKVSQSQLKLIQKRIDDRKKLVRGLEQQIDLLNIEITNRNVSINGMNDQLELLRMDYAKMVRAAYKNYKLNNFLLFLFAADDFNDTSRRIDFMRRYNRVREDKALEISSFMDSLSREVASLDKQLSELDQTKKSRNDELSSLGKDESQYKADVNKLKSQETQLNKQLKEKQKIVANAQKQIEKIIAEEERKARSKTLTAAEQAEITQLTGKFEDNKGKLPYPVRNGVVIDKFGRHASSLASGIVQNYQGINMTSERGSAVSCVFEGEVVQVFGLPGMNMGVIVKHGSYMTVYANIVDVAVKPGAKVSLNQKIGSLSNTTDSDMVYLHFQILKNGTHIDPLPWLRR